MLRRSTILVISLVLCGVMALSVPAMADRNSQTTKSSAPTVSVTVVKTSAASSMTKSEFVRAGWKDGLRFWLRNWFGWPHIQILDPKPSLPDEPQKSSTDPNKRNDDIAQDNGGDVDA
jgi:hypothetical protein